MISPCIRHGKILSAHVLSLCLFILGGVSCSNELGSTPSATSTPVERDEPLQVTEAPLETRDTARQTVPPSVTETPNAMPTTVSATETPSAAMTPAPPELNVGSNLLVVGSLLWAPLASETVVELPLEVGNQPWSPNGRALVGWDRQNQELVVFDLELQVSSSLANSSAWYSVPFWSPDDSSLLYTIPGTNPILSTVVVYDVSAQEEVVVAEDVELLSLAGWSYDSQEIAFVHIRGEDQDRTTTLEVINLENRARNPITLPSANIEMASWSRTRKELLLYATRGEPFYNPALPVYVHRELYLTSLNAGDATRILPDDDNEHAYYIHSYPWSSDGERIIYSDAGTICVFEFTTQEETCPHELNAAIAGTGATGGRYPSWSRDGNWISLILQYESQQCNPFAVVKLDGTGLTSTDSQPGACSVFGPIWSPLYNADDG